MLLHKALCVYLIAIKTVWCFYQSASNVTSLNIENFEQNVYVDRIWVVQFYSYKSKECQTFEKEFSVSANILKNVVKFGAVNVENNTELAKSFNVQDTNILPVIKIFGIQDGEGVTYNGSKTSKDLVDSILTHILEKIKSQFGEILPENLVMEVTDKTFDRIITNSPEPWLVQFYAPWCVHCQEFKPIWEQAAVYLKGKIKLASLDATANKFKTREYDIKAYPTVKMLPPGQKSPKFALEYTNERSVAELINWVQELLPGPEVIQLINAQVFQVNCMSKKLCIISLLPHILDCNADCRENYLGMLQQIGETHKRHQWGWIWCEGGAQKAMEGIFGTGEFGYPTMVVLNPTKKKYTVFKGAFTKNNINEFLIHLAKANAIGVGEDITEKIVEIEEWDGGDFNDVSEDLDDSDIKDEL